MSFQIKYQSATLLTSKACDCYFFLYPMYFLASCPLSEGVCSRPPAGCAAAMATSSTGCEGYHQTVGATEIMGECPILYKCKLSSFSLGQRVHTSAIIFLLPPGVSLYE